MNVIHIFDRQDNFCRTNGHSYWLTTISSQVHLNCQTPSSPAAPQADIDNNAACKRARNAVTTSRLNADADQPIIIEFVSPASSLIGNISDYCVCNFAVVGKHFLQRARQTICSSCAVEWRQAVGWPGGLGPRRPICCFAFLPASFVALFCPQEQPVLARFARKVH